MISVFNLCGRFFWASISDYIGRRNTYYCFFALGSALYLSIPLTAMMVSANPMIVWLIMFYAITMVVFTMYGGGFATIPAYLSDVFGNLHVGLYNITMFVMAGLLAIAFFANFMIRPVAAKHHLKSSHPNAD